MPLTQSDHSVADHTLARSLSNAFYVTSYQSDIARHAGQLYIRFCHQMHFLSVLLVGKHQRSCSAGEADSTGTLTGQLESRYNSISTQLPSVPQRAKRICSAPLTRPSYIPTRSAEPLQLDVTAVPIGLQRWRSFSSVQKNYPTRGERLKEIFTVFPSPQPQPVSQRASRPSSAVTLRAGMIPSLRQPQI